MGSALGITSLRADGRSFRGFRLSGLLSAAEGVALLPALLVLVLAGTITAGVAVLVSSAYEGGADRLDADRALYAAESGRLLARAGRVVCDGTAYLLGARTGFLCELEAETCGGLDRIVGWSGGASLETSLATQEICAFAGGAGRVLDEFDPDRTEDVRYGDNISISGGNRTFRNIAFGDNLSLSGKAIFQGEACFGDNANLSGNPDFEPDLTGVSIACFGDDATISGAGSGCDFSGEVHAGSNMRISGSPTFCGDAYFGPGLTITGAQGGGNEPAFQAKACFGDTRGDAHPRLPDDGIYFDDPEYDERCHRTCPANCADGGMPGAGGSGWSYGR